MNQLQITKALILQKIINVIGKPIVHIASQYESNNEVFVAILGSQKAETTLMTLGSKLLAVLNSTTSDNSWTPYSSKRASEPTKGTWRSFDILDRREYELVQSLAVLVCRSGVCRVHGQTATHYINAKGIKIKIKSDTKRSYSKRRHCVSRYRIGLELEWVGVRVHGRL